MKESTPNSDNGKAPLKMAFSGLFDLIQSLSSSRSTFEVGSVSHGGHNVIQVEGDGRSGSVGALPLSVRR